MDHIPPGMVNVCWNMDSYGSTLRTAFTEMLDRKILVDVALAAENLKIPCHRLVLVACSPYFARMLAEHPPSSGVVLCLIGVKDWQLQAIISFMYTGQVVNVTRDQLEELLVVANSLKIQGLANYSTSVAACSLDDRTFMEDEDGVSTTETESVTEELDVCTSPSEDAVPGSNKRKQRTVSSTEPPSKLSKAESEIAPSCSGLMENGKNEDPQSPAPPTALGDTNCPRKDGGQETVQRPDDSSTPLTSDVGAKLTYVKEEAQLPNPSGKRSRRGRKPRNEFAKLNIDSARSDSLLRPSITVVKEEPTGNIKIQDHDTKKRSSSSTSSLLAAHISSRSDSERNQAAALDTATSATEVPQRRHQSRSTPLTQPSTQLSSVDLSGPPPTCFPVPTFTPTSNLNPEHEMHTRYTYATYLTLYGFTVSQAAAFYGVSELGLSDFMMRCGVLNIHRNRLSPGVNAAAAEAAEGFQMPPSLGRAILDNTRYYMLPK